MRHYIPLFIFGIIGLVTALSHMSSGLSMVIIILGSLTSMLASAWIEESENDN